MISLMVCRDAKEIFKREYLKDLDDREVVLEVKNLSVKGRVKNVSFQLHKGEVLGLTGLVGSGRSELLKAIFGSEKIDSGEILVNGRREKFKHSSDAIKSGIGLVPEDRKGQGLFLKMPVRDNMTIVHLKKLAGKLFINMKKTNGMSKEYINILSIKTPGMMQLVKNLSGGNQQKTIIARWLMHKPQILLMDEPTHGIDVSAKLEIYSLIDRIAKTGVSVILLSSELPEVITMSDRVMVMHHGELRGILNNGEVTQVKVMQLTLESASAEMKKEA